MATRIVRRGDALTVEIPEELAAQASLIAGEAVEWIPNGAGSLALVKETLAATVNARSTMTLDELLEGIPEGTRLGEYDWGSPRGAEVW